MEIKFNEVLEIKKYFNKGYLTRILILGFDFFLCLVSFIMATLLRYDFYIPEHHLVNMIEVFSFVAGIRLLSFLYFRTYSGIIRFAGEQDAIRVFSAVTASSVFIFIFHKVSGAIGYQFKMPYSIMLTDYIITLFLLITYRIIVKELYSYAISGKIDKEKVVIFGGGKAGLIAKRAIDQDGRNNFQVVAFFDDYPVINRKIMEGVMIYETNKYFEKIIEKNNVKRAIIAIHNISPERKKEFIDMCLEKDIKVMEVPPVQKWLNGNLNANQIVNIDIEELLGRPPIQINNDNIGQQVTGKVLLITGAAGSIGSEIVRQLIKFNPAKLVLVDQAETPLVDLQLEIEENLSFLHSVPYVADVRDLIRMEYIFAENRPEMVFHAAAYKHVPMMEINPVEAIKVNVIGSGNVANLSVKYGAKKYVMVSTDKAVNPTNVMGASKRIAEIFIQSLNNADHNKNGTRFITTRFGNVLGSNGSVIPRFKKQIEAGGPVTVTHPDITRYFMTIPEACRLVLEAGSMGKGGEIYVFDMGEVVKISDLAKKMIRLAGFVPGKDIEIVYSGLRPGEKITEELFQDKETLSSTHHEKIMVAKVREYDFEPTRKAINDMLDEAEKANEIEMVRKMKKLVPEYISKNSKFEELDSVPAEDEV